MALPGIDPRAKLSSVAIEERAKELKQQDAMHATAEIIASAKEATPRKIDPAKVRWSQWGNRSQSRFKGPKFDAFVEDIRSAGGNKQAALVRPIPKTPEGYEYEIAYGHRRHRACLVAGQPYLAAVKELTDMQLQVEMEVENRGREDTSTWERAVQYKKQLPTYTSVDHMAATMNVTKQTMHMYMRIATMPQEVLDLIDDDLSITQRNALGIITILETKDPKELATIKSTLTDLAASKEKFTADELLKKLKVKPTKAVSPTGKPVDLLTEDGRNYGTLVVNRAKQLRLTIDEVTEGELKEITKMLSKIIKR